MMQNPPSYTKLEIERRWLVQSDRVWDAQATRVRLIEDRYINDTRLRLRKVSENGLPHIYKLGKKYLPAQLGWHHVVSTYLSEVEFQLLASLPARVACKRRLSIDVGALDIYESPNFGLHIFEVEFANLGEATYYEPPSWVGQEITHDLSRTGYALALRNKFNSAEDRDVQIHSS